MSPKDDSSAAMKLPDELRARFDLAASRSIASKEALEAALQDKRPPGASQRRFFEATREVTLLLAEVEQALGTPTVRARGRIWHLARVGGEVSLVSLKEDQIAE